MNITSPSPRVIIASDSFKGSLTSLQAGRAMERGVIEAIPSARVTVMAMADGGEGSSEAIAEASGGQWIEVATADPLGRPLHARYLLALDGTAYIDLAAASGLPLLSDGERDPSLTSTLGTGLMMADAIGRGVTRLTLFVGGSATNDAATGLLSALGFRFLDAGGKALSPCGGNLGRIAAIDTSRIAPRLRECNITVACDVDNPFVGPRGAAAVFAPQKGADAAMVSSLDWGMRHFAQVIADATGIDITDMPGAGAAGGVAGALHALLGATLKGGAEIVLDAQGFTRLLADADLVITGEGRSDSQTLSGKAPAVILRTARRAHVPVMLISGRIDDANALLAAGFAAVAEATPRHMPLSQAMHPATATRLLTHATRTALT